MCGLLPTRLSGPRFPTKASRRKAAKLRSMAQLIEDSIPNFTREEERQFYREVVKSYRTAARGAGRSANFRSC